MAERDQNEGSGQQPPIGQQSDDRTTGQSGRQEQGQQAQQQYGQQAQGSEPPRSMGTRGTEFGQTSDEDETGQQGQSGTGQADLGTQADTTLAGRADQQDLGRDQAGSTGGSSGSPEPSSEGFVGSQSDDSGEYLQQGGTPQAGFAEQGSGAPNEGSDIERDSERSQNRDSDIEGSSGNI